MKTDKRMNLICIRLSTRPYLLLRTRRPWLGESPHSRGESVIKQ